MDFRTILRAAIRGLGDGYARDLLESGLRLESSYQDADSAFRSLMLDEGWELGNAERAWSAMWEAAEVGLSAAVQDCPF